MGEIGWRLSPRSLQTYAWGRKFCLIVSLLAFGLLADGIADVCKAGDWPQILGPHRNGKSDEHGLPTSWPAAGPPIVWQAATDTGYAAPAIADGRLFHFGRFGDAARSHGDVQRLRLEAEVPDDQPMIAFRQFTDAERAVACRRGARDARPPFAHGKRQRSPPWRPPSTSAGATGRGRPWS